MTTSVIVGICLYVAFGLFVLFVLIKVLVQVVIQLEVKRLYKQLSNYFNSRVEVDNSDIETIVSQRLSKESYLPALEGYRLYLLDGHTEKVKDSKRLNSILNDLIKQKKESAPYDGIGDREKKAMLSIESLVPDANSKAIVKDDLIDLSESIRGYKKELNTKETIKNWVAIVGLAFSVITFFVGTRISNKSFDTINQHLSGIEVKIDTLKTMQSQIPPLMVPMGNEVEQK